MARRAYAWLAASLLVFTVYVSLLPFRFEPVALDAAWEHFARAIAVWPARLPRANFLANLLLFVPIGFGLAGARLVDAPERRWTTALVLAVLVSVATSLTAEFLQVFAPGRVVSGADVVAQTTGCTIGLALWMLAGQALTIWVRQSRTRTRHDRLVRVLVAYAALWAFANLAPFDITINPGTLAARVRRGAIAVVPFAQPLTPQVWWDAAVTVASSIPIGMLAVSGWWTRATLRGAVAASALGVIGLILIEGAQVFIRSHTADATDVVCGAVGVVGGVIVGTRLWGRDRSRPSTVDGGAPRWAIVGVGLWCVMVAAYHWQPFDFGVDYALVRQKAARLSLVPFAGYGVGSDLAAFNNVLAKLATALPLGLLAAFASPRRIGMRMAAPVWVACATAVFGVVEVGQFFVPSRVPDPTDVWIGVVASLVGFALGRWLRDGYGVTVSGARSSG